MIALDAQQEGFDDAILKLVNLPGIYTRARKSALSSTGWWMMTALRNHIEYGGNNWPELHPLSVKFKKKRGGKIWGGQRRAAHKTAFFWLGKFARYRTDADTVDIDFGKSRKGKPGTYDWTLAQVVTRAEYGEKIAVTDKMRRMLGATRKKRPKKQIPGETYFPLKKSTTQIVIPPRPIFAPVWAAYGPKIPAYFSKKFLANLERYMSGTEKTVD